MKTLVNFWIRRWFRTLPAYFLVLSILTAYSFQYVDGFELGVLPSFLTFSQNLFYEDPKVLFPEAWSLSVEEWFYVLTPSLAFVAIRIFKVEPRKAVLITLLTMVLFSTAFRLWRYVAIEVCTINQWDLVFRKQVVTRLDSLSYGAIAAYLYRFHRRVWERYRIHACAAGVSLFALSKSLQLFGLVASLEFYNCVFSFTLTSLATLCVLPYLNSIERGSGPVYTALTTISLISYSMYLINLSMIKNIVLASFDWTVFGDDLLFVSMIEYAVFWVLTVLVSILLYKYFEVPTTRMRRRFAGQHVAAWSRTGQRGTLDLSAGVRGPWAAR